MKTLNFYWLLTIDRQKEGQSKKETIFYEGEFLSNFVLIEQELGRNTVILYSQVITKEEYEKAISLQKLIAKNKNQSVLL